MGRNETEHEPEAHGGQGERAVVAFGHDHLGVPVVEPEERKEEKVSGDERDDRRIYIIG